MNDERRTVTIVGKNYLQKENDNTVLSTFMTSALTLAQ